MAHLLTRTLPQSLHITAHAYKAYIVPFAVITVVAVIVAVVSDVFAVVGIAV